MWVGRLFVGIRLACDWVSAEAAGFVCTCTDVHAPIYDAHVECGLGPGSGTLGHLAVR